MSFVSVARFWPGGMLGCFLKVSAVWGLLMNFGMVGSWRVVGVGAGEGNRSACQNADLGQYRKSIHETLSPCGGCGEVYTCFVDRWNSSSVSSSESEGSALGVVGLIFIRGNLRCRF